MKGEKKEKIYIHRNPNRKSFSSVDNTYIYEQGLSLQAKGLMTLFLRQKDDWIISVDEMTTRSNSKKTTVRNALKELIAFGYVTESQERRPNGKYGAYIYEVWEIPQAIKPIAVKPISGKADSGKADKPKTDKAVQPIAVKVPLINTNNKINTNITNTNNNNIVATSPKYDDDTLFIEQARRLSQMLFSTVSGMYIQHTGNLSFNEDDWIDIFLEILEDYEYNEVIKMIDVVGSYEYWYGVIWNAKLFRDNCENLKLKIRN